MCIENDHAYHMVYYLVIPKYNPPKVMQCRCFVNSVYYRVSVEKLELTNNYANSGGGGGDIHSLGYLRATHNIIIWEIQSRVAISKHPTSLSPHLQDKSKQNFSVTESKHNTVEILRRKIKVFANAASPVFGRRFSMRIICARDTWHTVQNKRNAHSQNEVTAGLSWGSRGPCDNCEA